MDPYWTNGVAALYQGDARALPLADESIHCVVTSPPYWGLRSYGGGSSIIGLEPTFDEHLENVVAVFREVRRVLRKDGTLWLNYGDAYSSGNGKMGWPSSSNPARGGDCRLLAKGFKPKNLMMMPARVAMALQEDGWWLRSDIIWSKPNPMPESVYDRPASAHEHIFLLSKAARYFYDAEAVMQPQSALFLEQHSTGTRRRGALGKTGGSARAKADFRDAMPDYILPNGRNLRNVWMVPTQGYSGAHFATFPEKIPEICILAGTSGRGVCAECGSPWRRIIEIDDPQGRLGKSYHDHTDDLQVGQRGVLGAEGAPTRKTIGWEAACDHDGLPVPATVLDPFVGSGTTCTVAQKLGRRSVGVDLKTAYLDLAVKRIMAVSLPLPL